jgi:hypothetical protein
VAPLLDDLLYGKKPKPFEPADWQRISMQEDQVQMDEPGIP